MEISDFKKIAELDLYEILNVNQKDDLKKIKKSYKKLVLKIHPDKPTGDREMFELVNLAYLVLKNEKNRKIYDSERDNYIENNKSFENLKFNRDNKNIIPISKEDAQKEYINQEMMLNKKHGFDIKNDKPISQSEMMKRINDLNFSRNNFLTESKSKFKKVNLSNYDFNDSFINDVEVDNDISNDIIAFNDSNNSIVSNYSSINNFDLYSSIGSNSSNYSSLENAFSQKLPKNINNNYSDHNSLTDTDRGSQKERLAEYNRLTTNIKSMKVSDFN